MSGSSGGSRSRRKQRKPRSGDPDTGAQASEGGVRDDAPARGNVAAAAEEGPGGKAAGYAAYAATLLFFAGLVVGIVAVRPEARPGARTDDRSSQLVDLDESRGTALASAVLGAIALLGVLALGVFLLNVLRRRRPETPSWLVPVWIGSTALLAVSNVLGWFAVADLATTFTDSGTRTEARADALVDDSGLLNVTQIVQVAAAVAFGLTLAFLCRRTREADLLPPMLEYWGYGTAACMVVLPLAGQALLVGWVASAGMIAADQWPGGRLSGWGRPQAGAAG